MSSSIAYREQQLFVESVSLKSVAKKYGTPCYVYSKEALARNWLAYQQALPKERDALVCYAVKANSNIAILNLLAKWGAGFDIVSQGELERVLVAGGDPHKVVFSGVGKTEVEIARALEVGIFRFNVESIPELERIQLVAKRENTIASVALRINPDVDAGQHPYISTGMKDNKFGIAFEDAISVFKQASEMSHIAVKGVDCHIGSQITLLAPFEDAVDRVLVLLSELASLGINVTSLDLGGGLGVNYQQEDVPSIADYVSTLCAKVLDSNLTLIFEPGRSMVADCGLLLTEVQFLKQGETKSFVIADAGMTELMRPALYQSWHDVLPVQQKKLTPMKVDLVGPICESGDFLAKDRMLAVEQGDLLAVTHAGAYGMVMASHYNSRPNVAEILVDGDFCHVIRQRESYEDLWALEKVI